MAIEDVAPGTVRRDPGTGSVAVKTAPSTTVGAWFLFDPVNGGHYTDEVPDHWPELATVPGGHA